MINNINRSNTALFTNKFNFGSKIKKSNDLIKTGTLNISNKDDETSGLMEKKQRIKEQLNNVKNGNDPVMEKLYARYKDVLEERRQLYDKYTEEEDSSKMETDKVETEDTKEGVSILSENLLEPSNFIKKMGKEWDATGREIVEIEKELFERGTSLSKGNRATVEERENAISDLEEQLKSIDEKLSGYSQGSVLDVLDEMQNSQQEQKKNMLNLMA